ncbi:MULTISPECIES: c-type cytochrome [Rhodobacterales]|uniref:Mono/diheme cytochrome c family protein n=2 Tax=Roseobacteraceae TaxID=2854170 RepID=A0A2T0WCJ8_9RHOB|nr:MULTISPECIES: cytochrome c [Roseobacteraceae]MEE3070248.1 cytochrome c [Pseudomonadota bacterium]PRY84431.1 mono/diheme cytochrome c family protein [Donghicola tyrosinivorans]CUH81889.1 putative bifunctional cbb3-type cytochrome c oxidase subunit II/cytochrome c [Tropicibacter naphthalenivorans]SMD02252.1 Cytochrome c, mono-and diheme variants [Tropicibacter naphthalenivorans]BBU59608.1 cytochrome c [Mameliella alba]
MKGSVSIIGAALVLAQTALADTPDIAEGEVLYAENCASCHGAELQGQPDWRAPGPDGRLPAPPHDETGHTWHHSDRVLFGYTKLGGKGFMAQQGMEFDSGMPGFDDRLSDQQIRNILAYIRSTWPDRTQQVQAERSKADMENGDN